MLFFRGNTKLSTLSSANSNNLVNYNSNNIVVSTTLEYTTYNNSNNLYNNNNVISATLVHLPLDNNKTITVAIYKSKYSNNITILSTSFSTTLATMPKDTSLVNKCF